MADTFPNLWKLNWKMFLSISLLQIIGCVALAYPPTPRHPIIELILCILAVYVITVLGFFLGVFNSFRVIRQLTEDTSNLSILPLFDSGCTVGLKNEKSWVWFTTPVIHATISGLPVTISYTSSGRYTWSFVTFDFSPLMREGSNRIFGTSVFFIMYYRKVLKKDIKPEVLKCVAETKADNLLSGAGRVVSAIHKEQYAE